MPKLKDKVADLLPIDGNVIANARQPDPGTAAKGMGFFGLALGLAELFATRKLTRGLDIRGREGFVRAMGLREIASSALIGRNRRTGMWSRVAGDALDLAALAAMFPGNKRKRNLGLALGAVVGATALDVLTARALQKRRALTPA